MFYEDGAEDEMIVDDEVDHQGNLLHDQDSTQGMSSLKARIPRRPERNPLTRSPDFSVCNLVITHDVKLSDYPCTGGKAKTDLNSNNERKLRYQAEKLKKDQEIVQSSKVQKKTKKKGTKETEVLSSKSPSTPVKHGTAGPSGLSEREKRALAKRQRKEEEEAAAAIQAAAEAEAAEAAAAEAADDDSDNISPPKKKKKKQPIRKGRRRRTSISSSSPEPVTAAEVRRDIENVVLYNAEQQRNVHGTPELANIVDNVVPPAEKEDDKSSGV